MSQVYPLPVQQYIRAVNLKKEAEKIEKENREATIEHLKVADLPGITMSIPKPSEVLNEKVLLPWAYQNLPNDVYESLFLKVFDPNKFVELKQQGKISEEQLPPGWKETKESSPRITVNMEKVQL